MLKRVAVHAQFFPVSLKKFMISREPHFLPRLLSTVWHVSALFGNVLQCMRHFSHRPIRSVLFCVVCIACHNYFGKTCHFLHLALNSVLFLVSRFSFHHQSLKICALFDMKTPLLLLRCTRVSNVDLILNDELRGRMVSTRRFKGRMVSTQRFKGSTASQRGIKS